MIYILTIIYGLGIYILAQRSNKILSIGATEDEKGFEKTVNLDEVYFLSKSLWECFTNLENIELQKNFCWTKARNDRRLSCYWTTPKISNDIYCNFGHYRHGILLSPISSKILADYICGKK